MQIFYMRKPDGTVFEIIDNAGSIVYRANGEIVTPEEFETLKNGEQNG